MEKETRTILRGFFQDQILEKRRFLIYAYNFFAEESRPLLSHVDELDSVLYLRWRFRNKRLQDCKQWITVFERGLAIAKEKRGREAKGQRTGTRTPRLSGIISDTCTAPEMRTPEN